MNSIDETAFAATFRYIDTWEYYVASELEGSGTLIRNTLYVLSMCCLCPVYVLSMSCICVVYVLSKSCQSLVYFLSMCFLSLVYVLSIWWLCVVYIMSMSCICLFCLVEAAKKILCKVSLAGPLRGGRGWVVKGRVIKERRTFLEPFFQRCRIYNGH